MKNSETILESQLRNYASQGPYPMHMPGHKRSFFGGLPYGWDVTEVPGTDDLHDAHGILMEAMSRTAELYGAARTWFLVNGSTVGILAGIRAVAPYGSEIIVARNCHKSVYHAIELQNLTVHWVLPRHNAAFDIYEEVDRMTVEEALEAYPNAKAVVITSPTYEGVVSDVRSIANACHAAGVPLLVDEAHGAHLGFHPGFPDTAIHQGADIVVQSPHKTLPSLTQTAWMHLGEGALVAPEAIDQQLDIFETSSPSYILMTSLDTCTGVLAARGNDMFEALVKNLEMIHEPRHLEIYHAAHHDPSKVLISGKRCGMTGAEMAQILREEFHYETEMALGYNVLAMTSICDTKIGISHFADAIKALDRRAVVLKEPLPESAAPVLPEVRMTIAEALGQQAADAVPAEEAAGHVAAEYVYAYPPGIPVIVPGEVITAELIAQLDTWAEQGATIHHSGRRDGYVVVAESEMPG